MSRKINDAIKLASNCQQFCPAYTYDYVKCIGNIERIRAMDYMCYSSDHISPNVKFVECSYYEKILIYPIVINFVLNICNFYYFRSGIHEILQGTLSIEEIAIAAPDWREPTQAQAIECA